VLSAGIIDGRNIWRSDLDAATDLLAGVAKQRGEKLWIAPSCSLLHIPVDLDADTEHDAELKGWLSFAVQKLDELKLLAAALSGNADGGTQAGMLRQRAALQGRRSSTRIHNRAVQERLNASAALSRERLPFTQRIAAQQKKLG